MENLEIGQRVTWTVGNVKIEGAVLEYKGEVTDVVTHYVNGRQSVRTLEVQTELLTKI